MYRNTYRSLLADSIGGVGLKASSTCHVYSTVYKLCHPILCLQVANIVLMPYAAVPAAHGLATLAQMVQAYTVWSQKIDISSVLLPKHIFGRHIRCYDDDTCSCNLQTRIRNTAKLRGVNVVGLRMNSTNSKSWMQV